MLHNELVITSALWRLSFPSSSLGVMMASAHCVDRVEFWRVLGINTLVRRFWDFCILVRRFLGWCTLVRRFLDWCTPLRRDRSSCTLVRRFLDLCTLVQHVLSSCTLVHRFLGLCTLVRRLRLIFFLLIEPVE